MLARAICLTAICAGSAHACPLGADAGTPLADPAGGPLRLAWKSEPTRIPNGKPFVLRLALCPAGARLLAVDAVMPAHGHGMNYRPSVKDLGAGRFEVQGLLWHMAGRWELRFDVAPPGGAADGSSRLTLKQTVDLK
jgi:hypothetical protein